MLNEQQLKNRLNGIGGSDAGAICGVSPYSNALDVYLSKKGLKVSKPDSRQIKWGNLLEPVIRANYAKEFEKEVIETEETFYHKDYPFMLAHVDGLIGDDGILEVKTTQFLSKEWGGLYTDFIPKSYLLQCVHYMAVLDRDYVDLALLVGGSDERFYHIKRNLALENKLIKAECDFWDNHIVKNVAPDMYSVIPVIDEPVLNTESNVNIGEIQSCIDEYIFHKKQCKDHESDMESYKNIICDFLERHQLSEIGNLTYKSETRTIVDKKLLEKDLPDIFEKYSNTKSFKVFRLKEEKQ